MQKDRILITRSTLFILLSLCLGSLAQGQTSLSLEDALARAYQQNPEISAAEARMKAQQAEVGLKRSLANPRIGLMQEKNMTLDQEMMGPMTSWSISQEVMFPYKYSLMGSAQEATADAARQALADIKLSIRQRVISTYTALYSARQILSLFQAQREALREIARIAEARRATGAAPQQDEMKAHVEQTKIENEILMQEQEVEEAEAMLNALLKRPAQSPISLSLSQAMAKPPTLQKTPKEIERLSLENSRSLRAGRAMVSEAEKMKTLAKYSYAPDFMLSFRKPFENAPPDAYAFGIEMTIPLWFFSRQNNEVQSASARVVVAQSELDTMTYETQAQVRALSVKVDRFEKMLRIYDSALVPQATSSLNSSRAAYTAGRAGFLELLDAERSLYEVRIGYHKALSLYIDSLTQLERVAGVSLSTLPFGDNQ